MVLLSFNFDWIVKHCQKHYGPRHWLIQPNKKIENYATSPPRNAYMYSIYSNICLNVSFSKGPKRLLLLPYSQSASMSVSQLDTDMGRLWSDLGSLKYALIPNGNTFLYFPTLFWSNIHMYMCVREAVWVSKIKKEEDKDTHCTSTIAMAWYLWLWLGSGR